MIRKLQKIYALSEQGAKDLVKATAWTVAANLSLMVPMSILMLALMKIIDALTEGSDPCRRGMENRWGGRCPARADLLDPLDAV